MHGPMMRRAEHDEKIRIVGSTFGTKFDVVNIEKDSMAATGYHAATAVSAHDLTADGGRNVLPRATPAHCS